MLRLATWNCRGALDKKSQVVNTIDADVLVVQECSEADLLDTGGPWCAPYDGGNKGTGVFFRAPWNASVLEADRNLPWVLPVELVNSSTGQRIALLAIWANKTKNSPTYAAQFALLLESYAHLIRSGGCVIAGDLNASIQGPSRKPHAQNLQRANNLNMVSAYHHTAGIQHGNEPDMTLRWIGRGRREYFYHCDYIFLPKQLAAGSRCKVLDTFVWNPPVSDHQPVIVDIPAL